MRACAVAILVILVGCGDVKPIKVDAAMVDAAMADAAIDAPALPATHHHYVFDRMLLPATNTQARDYGLDLNGDTIVDNQLGMVIATLAGMGMDSQADMDKAIDTGTAIMLADLGSDDLTTEPTATFTIYQGTNPMPPACASTSDTICRKHLTGSGSFMAKPAPVDPALLGTIAAGKLAAGPGHLTIQFTFWGSAPVPITLRGARVDLTSSATASTGKLGGGVTKTDLDTQIIPAMRDGFQATVMQDCTTSTPPDCGCAVDTTGKTLLGLFDTDPKDCTITVSEVQNNSLIVSLLAPDVTVEGMQALSLGVSVRAVPATFTAPM